jgi:hypothetical protein
MRRFLLILAIVICSPTAPIAGQGKLFVSSTGFSARYADSWYAQRDAPGQLVIHNTKGPVTFRGRLENQASIFVSDADTASAGTVDMLIASLTRWADTLVSRRSVELTLAPGRCESITEVVFHADDSGGALNPGPPGYHYFYYCVMRKRRVLVSLGYGSNDARGLEYQRVARAIAESIRVPPETIR